MSKSTHNSPNSKKKYHIRSESSILKRNNKLTRKRSATAGTPKNYISKIKQKKVNRRFSIESIPETKLTSVSKSQDDCKYNKNHIVKSKYIIKKNIKKITKIHQNKSQILNKNVINSSVINNNSNSINIQHEMRAIINEFRNILTPLQQEIHNLKQITSNLQTQITILKNENIKLCANQLRPSLVDDQSFINYVASAANKPNNSMQLNPAYLFSPRSVDRGSVGTVSTSLLNINDHDPALDINSKKQLQSINKHQNEEDDLEIYIQSQPNTANIANDLSRINLDKIQIEISTDASPNPSTLSNGTNIEPIDINIKNINDTYNNDDIKSVTSSSSSISSIGNTSIQNNGYNSNDIDALSISIDIPKYIPQTHVQTVSSNSFKSIDKMISNNVSYYNQCRITSNSISISIPKKNKKKNGNKNVDIKIPNPKKSAKYQNFV